ncbi:MAG TPA: amidase family protein, partial [Xanthobacteraceae bacterium]
MEFSYSFDFQTLASHYKTGLLKPTAVVAEVFSRIHASGDDHVWTHVLPQADVMQAAQALEQRRNQRGDALPLYGLPFAIKDNIDVAGLPTTAACPAFAYIADK